MPVFELLSDLNVKSSSPPTITLLLYTTSMETIDDYSYGVIPLFFTDGTWEVFLINQYGSANDVYWTFPKGHPEKNETKKETALREFHEETGMDIKRFLSDREYSQSYIHQGDGVMVNKTVGYFVGEVVSKGFLVQAEEVKEAGWFSLEKAREQLTYDHAKDMLRKAVKDIAQENTHTEA